MKGVLTRTAYRNMEGELNNRRRGRRSWVPRASVSINQGGNCSTSSFWQLQSRNYKLLFPQVFALRLSTLHHDQAEYDVSTGHNAPVVCSGISGVLGESRFRIQGKHSRKRRDGPEN